MINSINFYIFVNRKYIVLERIMNRLRILRTMQGLTLDEVAAKLDGMVTKQAISKYERGLMAPSPAVLSALSKIYGVDLREPVPSSVYVTASWNFRRGQNMPAKIESAVKNNIIYCLEKYLGVEKRLGLSSIFRSPFPKDYPATMESMEEAALFIRKKWQLGIDSIPYICRMLERAGIKVIEFDMEEGLDGVSGWANQKIPFIALRKDVKVDRKRFTALHELAHIIFTELENCTEKMKERLCNRFAAALLFPKEAFFCHIGKKRSAFALEELTELKTIYGISVAAIVHRAKDLGVITEAYYNHLFDDVINQNKMEDGWGVYPFDDKPGRCDEICRRGIAEGLCDADFLKLNMNVELKIL